MDYIAVTVDGKVMEMTNNEYIAVTVDGKVMEMTNNEQASLEAMQAYARLYKGQLSRVWANNDAYMRHSNGDVLHVHPIIEAGMIIGHDFISVKKITRSAGLYDRLEGQSRRNMGWRSV